MSAEKPPTMRQVLDSLARKVDVLTDDLKQRQSAKVNQSSPPPMTEARALDICMTALAGLETQQHHNRYEVIPDRSGIERTLRHLAARFGVKLIEREYEPCNRPHADALDRDARVSIVTGRLM